ncbi:MAG: undecaprenyl-diphosphate phosphatase [Candidatus Bipolaricaulota bacterium]
MIRYVLLGLVQGLTEFLPVSSSGHLVLAERWLGLDSPGVLLEAMLHWGTLAAILIVFRKDIVALLKSLRGKGSVERRKEVGFLIAGTVPIVVAALLFRETIQSAFSSLLAVGIGLLLTALVLTLGHLARARVRRPSIRFLDAVVVGLAQAAAVFPGISRSGVTISAGTAMGLSAADAVRFSFLLAIPALLGAGLLHLLDVINASGSQNWLGILIGTLCAFGSGWLALRAVLRLVRQGRLWIFAVYCFLVGAGTIVWSILY